MIRRSTSYCPQCNAGFWVEAGLLADDMRYRCDHCGSVIDVQMKWGKIKSISLVPTIKEEYNGCVSAVEDTTTPPPPLKTAWEIADDKWWADIGNRL